MYAEFKQMPGRSANNFRLDDLVYVYCDPAKMPADLQYLANSYQPAHVVGFIRQNHPETKLAIKLSASDVIYVKPVTFEALTPDEFASKQPSEIPDSALSIALQRAQEFTQPPRPLPACEYPHLAVGDTVVIFYAPTTDDNMLPDQINHFMTGRIYAFDDDYTLVRTDEECQRRQPDHDLYQYPYGIARHTPMAIWRGDYERMRQHPEWIESWLDYFEFPLNCNTFKTSRADFTEYLRASFAYIPPVEYPLFAST